MEPPPLPPLPPDALPDPRKRRRTAGFALIGVGGAGLVLGAVTGGIALGQKSDLATKCGASLQCSSTYAAQVNTYDGLRGLSMFGLWAGAAVAATGIVLVVTALPPKEAKAAQLFVGPGRLGVKGTF